MLYFSLRYRFRSGANSTSIGCPPHIIVVPLGDFHQDETMSCIESIRIALLQGSHSDFLLSGIRFGEQLTEHFCPDPLVLIGRMDIQMIEKQALANRLDHDKSGPFPLNHDMPGMFRHEARKESLTRPLRIET